MVYFEVAQNRKTIGNFVNLGEKNNFEDQESNPSLCLSLYLLTSVIRKMDRASDDTRMNLKYGRGATE